MNERTAARLVRMNLRVARLRWGKAITLDRAETLRAYTRQFQFTISDGDLILMDGGWYVTHAGLLRLARKRHCAGIHVEPVHQFSAPDIHRFAFKAIVRTSTRITFVGYGDADPSNVSPLVHGAEMRVAETRAVNRALRKAYGIGICSVEEIGSTLPPHERPVEHNTRKLPAQSTQANNRNGHASNGNGNGARVRDRLCQLIRQHKLDAELVKSYAVDFCGTKSLREASREQVEAFVAKLADSAQKDRNALLCQLNSYARPQAGAA